MSELEFTIENKKTEAEQYVCSAQPFELGAVVMTQGVKMLLSDNIGANLRIYIMRHQNGDWGDMPIEDKIANDEATKIGARIMSGYQICNQRIWIITEGDRSVTTVLFPFEY